MQQNTSSSDSFIITKPIRAHSGANVDDYDAPSRSESPVPDDERNLYHDDSISENSSDSKVPFDSNDNLKQESINVLQEQKSHEEKN
ncbi:hypothetical protein QTN25_006185 [Entamoeba marina]